MKLSTKLKKSVCFFIPLVLCGFGCLLLDSGMFQGMKATENFVFMLTCASGLAIFFSPFIAMEIEDVL
jgi:hypothetical protein